MSKKKKKVVIITEGGSKIGFGHIARCQALFQALKKRRINAEMIVDGDKSVKNILENCSYRIIKWQKNNEAFFKIVRNSDISIIDSYLANFRLYKIISSLSNISVYFDDFYRLDYPKGIVVNGCPSANRLKYRTNGSMFLMGNKYLSLRSDFWNVPKKIVSKNVNNVMISFGGDDIRNMIPRILKILTKEHANLKKIVIIGRAFKNLNSIKAVADRNTKLVYYPGSKKMRKIMLKASVAISAGGQTLYELARIGVPTIGVCVGVDQNFNLKALEKKGIIEYAGSCREKKVFLNILLCLKRLNTLESRLRISCKAKKLIDGKGAIRIADIIISKLSQLN